MGSRLVLAYLALQVLSGWLMLGAIAWCLLELYRGPSRERVPRRRARTRPVEDWCHLELVPSQRRGARFVADRLALGAAA